MKDALQPDPSKRLGSTWDSFIRHDFFSVLDFTALERKELEPVFIPSSEKTNFDATYDLEELLLEEAPLEARARKQKPRERLKDDATDKEIREDELYRMIESDFRPFDYTVAAYKKYDMFPIYLFCFCSHRSPSFNFPFSSHFFHAPLTFARPYRIAAQTGQDPQDVAAAGLDAAQAPQALTTDEATPVTQMTANGTVRPIIPPNATSETLGRQQNAIPGPSSNPNPSTIQRPKSSHQRRQPPLPPTVSPVLHESSGCRPCRARRSFRHDRRIAYGRGPGHPRRGRELV